MSDNKATHAVPRGRRSRAVLTAGLALLAALFLLTATAQPAAADDPGATIFPHDYGINTEHVTCYTPPTVRADLRGSRHCPCRSSGLPVCHSSYGRAFRCTGT